jgi:type II secretion system protein N
LFGRFITWGALNSSLFSSASHYLSRAVRKLLKGFLVVAGVLVALAGVGVLAINLYVQSAGTQKRIEHALSSGLKVPVHLTSTIVTPWSGLKASGITVPQVPPATGNFLEASGFTAHFDWLALLKHRLDASDVALENPVVTWFQSPGGRWELPRETPPRAPAAPARVQPAPVPSPAAPPAVPKPPGPPVLPWEISVHKLMVSGASFDFWDEKDIRVLEFAGVQFDCLDPRASGTKGTASCRNVSLRDRLFFRDMQTDWSFSTGALKLTSFQTSVGGGEIHGDAQVATQSKHSPFVADVNFEGVNIAQLMSEAGEAGGEVTGTLKGWLDLNGNTGKTSSLNGSGQLELTGGSMQNIDILQMLGKGLQIPDLVELNLKTAEVDARVVSGVVNVDKLLLQSQNLQVTAHGTIELPEKLALNARLTVNGSIVERLPAFILTYFKPADTGDSRYIDFEIGNTLGHPKTNLLENILGHRIQSQMTDLIKSIFGKKQEPEPVGPAP